MGFKKGIAALFVLLLGLWFTGLGVPDEMEISGLVVGELYTGLNCDSAEMRDNAGCQQAGFWKAVFPILGWILIVVDAFLVYQEFKSRG